MSDIKIKTPMEHLNIGQFNRGQSSKLIRNLVEHDSTAFIQKNGKPNRDELKYKGFWLWEEYGISNNNVIII